MPFLIQYIIKLSLSLAVIFLFYRFILRPLTFYTWNRWYLTGYSLIAFLIPFVDINPMLHAIGPEESVVINFIPVIDPASLKGQGWFHMSNRWNWLMFMLVAGIVVMMIRLLIQFLSYRRLKRNAVLLSDTPVKIFQVEKDIVPFSFGNAIFINSKQHSEQELHDIINHEFVHVKQKHTADMIWAEILCILNWYNPFAWLIKKVICQNLEFIADQQVLKNGLNKKDYQYLLLKVAGGASFRIANQFNFSFLHKRIAMMNKMKSAKLHLVKFLFILPLLAVLLLSFRERISGMLESDTIDQVVDIRPIKAPITVKSSNLENTSLPVNLDTIPLKSGSDTLKGKVMGVVFGSKDSANARHHHGNPLFIVDELVRDESYVFSLDPASIESIEVLKHEFALQYGDKGKNGAVRIRIKKDYVRRDRKDKNAEVTVIGYPRQRRDSITYIVDTIGLYNVHYESPKPNQSGPDSALINASLERRPTNPSTLRIKGAASPQDVLYVIDGVKQAKGTDMKNVQPNDIERIDILKDAHATELYGPEGAHGVIIITTRSGSKNINRTQSGNGVRQVEGKQVEPRLIDSLKPSH